jgi:hypothetical protein
MILRLYGFLTSKYFIAYWIACIIYIEYALGLLRKLRPKTKEEILRDEKYFAFKMIETKALNNVLYRFYLYVFAPLSIFRFLVAASAILV